ELLGTGPKGSDLSPLLIDDLRGWTNIEARQLHREGVGADEPKGGRQCRWPVRGEAQGEPEGPYQQVFVPHQQPHREGTVDAAGEQGIAGIAQGSEPGQQHGGHLEAQKGPRGIEDRLAAEQLLVCARAPAAGIAVELVTVDVEPCKGRLRMAIHGIEAEELPEVPAPPAMQFGEIQQPQVESAYHQVAALEVGAIAHPGTEVAEVCVVPSPGE